MSADPNKARELFLHAVGKLTADQWEAYVGGACAGDSGLARQVEDLLRVHREAGSFLDRPAAALGETGAFLPQLADRPDTPLTPEGAGTVVGPYRLMEQIGEGGFGLVFVAEQTHPVRRKVAVKILKPGMDTREVVARFEAERQALAMMDHPNIATVFDAGATPAGRPYFVMELVRGAPITQYCDDHRVTPRDRLRLFVDLCGAVQHAHQKGVIHRDLKPSNVLVSSHDGTPVVKVIDFGVAKAVGPSLTDKTVYTRFTQMVGTPLYMSPEQAGSSGLDVDTRTDIYALGVLLYELLTGTTPFDRERLQAAGYDEIRRIIREEEPARPSTRLSTIGHAATVASANRGTEPRKLTALLRGDLDWIVMKALEKDRTRRYETAAAFAADVDRFLADEPVLACPPTTGYRLRKFARRNRLALLTAGTVAGLLVAGTTVSTWQALRAADAGRYAAGQRDRAVINEGVAEEKRKEAQRVGEELRDTLYAAQQNLIGAAWEADNVARVRELLAAQVPAPGARDLRGFEWHYWDRLAHAEVSEVVLPVSIPGPPVGLPQFSRDGSRLLVPAVGKAAVELQVWDTETGARTFACPLPNPRGTVHALAPNGRRVAVLEAPRKGDRPGSFTLRVYDTTTGAQVGGAAVPAAGPFPAASLAPDTDSTRVLTLTGTTDESDVSWDSPRTNTRLDVWDTATGRALLTVQLGSVRGAAAVSPDGTRAAVVAALDGGPRRTAPHGIRVWDVAAGKELYTTATPGGESGERVTFSPDGSLLGVAGTSLWGKGVWVWEAATGKEVRAFGHHRAAGSLVFDPAGARLAAFDRASTAVAVFDPAHGVEREVIKGHPAGVVAAAFTADGRHLRTLSLDSRVRTWALGPAAPSSRAGTWNGIVPTALAAAAVSPDGLRVAYQVPWGPARPGPIEVKDVTGQVVQTIPAPGRLSALVGSLALDRGGRRLAVRGIGPGPNLWVYDVASGRQVLAADVPGVAPVALSPAGDRVAVPVGAGPPGVWRQPFPTVRVLAVGVPRGPMDLPLGVDADLPTAAFSADGRYLVTYAQRVSVPGTDNDARTRVRVWDMTDGRQLADLPVESSPNPNPPTAFYANGSLVAVPRRVQPGTTSRTVIDVWESATGRKRFELGGHPRAVTGICVSPDGRRLASVGLLADGVDSAVQIWDTTGGRELATLRCRGVVSGLAFDPTGHRLIGVRTILPEAESPLVVWDGRPRPPERP